MRRVVQSDRVSRTRFSLGRLTLHSYRRNHLTGKTSATATESELEMRSGDLNHKSQVTRRVAVGFSDLLGLCDDSISLQLKLDRDGYQKIFVCEWVVGGRMKLPD